MHLEESAEMYLETIYVLTQKAGYVRSVDVANSLGYSKPSVSRAVGLLKSSGYLEVGHDGALSLTPLGIETSKKIFERHFVIAEALKKLGVREETALVDACKMEHYISDESFEAIKRHFIENQKR